MASMASTACCEDMTVKTALKDDILRRVCSLKIWRKGTVTAPHKPILLLYALTRCEQAKPRMVGFEEAEKDLLPLLKAVQKNKPVVEPRYPFWRLQNDGVWVVEADSPMKKRRGNTDPLRSELLAKNAQGGFPLEIYRVLSGTPEFRSRLMRLIFERYFTDIEQAELREALWSQ